MLSLILFERMTKFAPDADRGAVASAPRWFETVALSTFLVISATALPANEATGKPAGKQAPAKENDDVSALVKNLDHPDFAVREASTAKLKQSDEAGVEALTQAGLSGSLESGLRAVDILRHLFLSDDDAAFDAAERGLEKIASEADHAAVAQRAAEVLDENQFTVIQKRSVSRVRKLGGQIQMDRERTVVINGQPMRPKHGWAAAAAIGPRWEGGEAGLRHLTRLRTLRTIYLISGHPLTDEDIQQIQADLPNVTFQHRGAAMLGVSTANSSLGCLIGSVRPGTGAAKGGIRTRDIVVEIAGEAVRSPDDLISIIGTKKAGETVEIVVLRGDPILRYKLTEILNRPGEFAPLLAIAIMNQMRTPVSVTLGEWNIDNG